MQLLFVLFTGHLRLFGELMVAKYLSYLFSQFIRELAMASVISTRIATSRYLMSPIYHFSMNSLWASRRGDPTICDFVLGGPHGTPLAAYTTVIQKASIPQRDDWYGYKTNEPLSRSVIAESLRRRFGIPFDPQDIFLTTGAFAALTVVLGTLLNPGDEVIFLSPPWFFYEAQIASHGGLPVRVKVNPTTFDLDIQSISEAISSNTRVIIINSPHNPTGKIYPQSTLQDLARLLESSNRQLGRPIYLISDEAYSKILYDGRDFHSPSMYYPHTFIIYTYGKILLAPGQRIGYIAINPLLSHRNELHEALLVSQVVSGYAFPNAILQHAISELEQLSIDLDLLQRKRDYLGTKLQNMGYDVTIPEGTFYMMVRSPWDDDNGFCDKLAESGVFCLPGWIVEMPGYFRISLTATEEMIERSLPVFAMAMENKSNG